MTWVVIVGAVWLAVAAVAAVLIGRALHVADEKQRQSADAQPDDPVVPSPRSASPPESKGRLSSSRGPAHPMG